MKAPNKRMLSDCFIDNHNEPVLAFVSRLRVESRCLSNDQKDEIEAGLPG